MSERNTGNTNQDEHLGEGAHQLPLVMFSGRDAGDEHQFTWDELMTITPEYTDPAMVSDEDLMGLVATALDREPLTNYKVTRPATGNILVRPIARFG